MADNKAGTNRLVSFIRENWLMIVIVFLTLLAAYLPYMQSGVVKGSDYNYHMARIDSLKEDLRNGVFPVKIHSVLCYDYGYGTGFFYPNFFLYIPACLRLAGLSLEISYKIFAALIFAAVFGSMYYSVWSLTKDKYAALLSAVCYVMSRQVLGSFYHAFTLGSSLGAIFIPLAIAGMLLFCAKDKAPVLLGIGFIGLIHSHILSTYTAFLACLILLLFHWKKVLIKPKKLLELGFTIGMVMALTVSFWGPMLEQLKAQTLKVSRPWTGVDENVLKIRDLFGESQGYLIFIITILAGFFILRYGRELKDKRLIYLLCFLGIGLTGITAFKGFWTLLKPVLNSIQFPVRMLFPANILIIFSLALLLGGMDITQVWKQRILAGGFILSACLGIQYMYGNMGRIVYPSESVIYEEIAGIGAGEEYLPVETKREMLTEPDYAVDNTGKRTKGSRQKGSFVFTADSSNDYYTVPFVWYKGYAAETDSGIRLETGKIPETSLLRVDMPERSGDENGEKLTIRVWYEGTRFQKLCYLLNAAAVLLAAAGLAGRRYWLNKWERIRKK